VTPRVSISEEKCLSIVGYSAGVIKARMSTWLSSAFSLLAVSPFWKAPRYFDSEKRGAARQKSPGSLENILPRERSGSEEGACPKVSSEEERFPDARVSGLGIPERAEHEDRPRREEKTLRVARFAGTNLEATIVAYIQRPLLHSGYTERL